MEATGLFLRLLQHLMEIERVIYSRQDYKQGNNFKGQPFRSDAEKEKGKGKGTARVVKEDMTLTITTMDGPP